MSVMGLVLFECIYDWLLLLLLVCSVLMCRSFLIWVTMIYLLLVVDFVFDLLDAFFIWFCGVCDLLFVICLFCVLRFAVRCDL